MAADCHRMGIRLLPPDINRSGLDFTIEAPGRRGRPPRSRAAGRARGIRFGLAAVKNVGEGPVQAILEARAGAGRSPAWTTWRAAWTCAPWASGRWRA